jgi:hypothetical protein
VQPRPFGSSSIVKDERIRDACWFTSGSGGTTQGDGPLDVRRAVVLRCRSVVVRRLVSMSRPGSGDRSDARPGGTVVTSVV